MFIKTVTNSWVNSKYIVEITEEESKCFIHILVGEDIRKAEVPWHSAERLAVHLAIGVVGATSQDSFEVKEED